MSTKITQKEAVFNAITSVLTENNIAFSEGMNVGSFMTRELRNQVNQILLQGFQSQAIELDGTHSESELKGYVSSLQSNWIKKDKRLNGGNKYSAKNPGSRQGSGDPQMKALRTLLSTLDKQEDKAVVEEHIKARLFELNSIKN